MLRNLHCILYMVEKAMQIVQGSMQVLEMCVQLMDSINNQCPGCMPLILPGTTVPKGRPHSLLSEATINWRDNAQIQS